MARDSCLWQARTNPTDASCTNIFRNAKQDEGGRQNLASLLAHRIPSTANVEGNARQTRPTPPLASRTPSCGGLHWDRGDRPKVRFTQKHRATRMLRGADLGASWGQRGLSGRQLARVQAALLSHVGWMCCPCGRRRTVAARSRSRSEANARPHHTNLPRCSDVPISTIRNRTLQAKRTSVLASSVAASAKTRSARDLHERRLR